MSRGNTTMHSTTASREETATEKWISEGLQFIGWYFWTHFKVFVSPKLFVTERYPYPSKAMKPGTFLIISLAVFCIVASQIPVMSEPLAKVDLLKVLEASPVFLKSNFTDVLGKYVLNLGMLTGGVVFVLGLFSGNDKNEFLSMLRLSCYFVVNILIVIILKYFIGLFLLMTVLKIEWLSPLASLRVLNVRWMDVVLCACLSISTLGYPFYLFAEKEKKGKGGLVLAGFVLILAVIFGNGYYFKKKIASRVKPETIVEGPEPKVISPAPETNMDITASGMGHIIPYAAKLMAIDSTTIPHNKTILISSGSPENPTVHFIGHRWGKIKYSLEGNFVVTNKTSTPVYFPWNRNVKVYLSLGTESLLNRCYIGDKEFPFQLVSASDGPLILGPKESKSVRIKYKVNRSMYEYLERNYREGKLKEHKVFIEIFMQNSDNNSSFKVNRQAVWDIYFN